MGLCCNVEGLQLQGHVRVLAHEGGVVVKVVTHLEGKNGCTVEKERKRERTSN